MTPAELLREQQALLQAFAETLDAEATCLGSGNADGERLSTLAASKQKQLSELDRLEALRREQQRSQGFGVGSQGAAQFANATGMDETWQRIRRLAEQVRQTNRLNGHIISQRLEHNQQAIDFLNRAIGGSVYGPSGQSRHGGFGGISSKA
ncbi:flagella synthesis protein FlgN [Salinicola acroporae]|uniref:Flagellar protein FlgN n=1 Tax=Salinicola acroporae TaxID=1541440 RepID=A0ABT6I5U9_9GAMM|nr:flagellar protein FlgN [Salinicola acroporae]MDH4573092.1 flagellar protein FlgN [Salinicola acroporae]